MKANRLLPRVLISVIWITPDLLRAQTVAGVSSVITFGESGSVTKVETADAPTVPRVAMSSQQPVAKTMQQLERISTGAGGASSLVLGGAGTARMGAETEVRVPRADEKGMSLELLKGKLFMNIDAEELKKRGAGEFRLKTPAALLAVKGTKFFATSGAGGDVIGVIEGGVSVLANGTRNVVSLQPGQAVNVTAGSVGAPRALSDEERGYQAEIDATQLERIPLGLVLYETDFLGGKPMPIKVFHQDKLAVGFSVNANGIVDFEVNQAKLTGHFFNSKGKADNIPRFEGDPTGDSYPAPGGTAKDAKRRELDSKLGEVGLKLGEDGSVGYSWNWARNAIDRMSSPEIGSSLEFNFSTSGKPGTVPQDKFVGLAFRVRTKGIFAIKTTWLFGGTTIFRTSSARGDSRWVDCVVPIDEGKKTKRGPTGTLVSLAINNHLFSVISYPEVGNGKSTPTRNNTASVSIKDIVFLTTK